MSRERGLVAGVSLVVACIVAIAAVLTLLEVWHFARACGQDGGHFSNDGGTAWCRYGGTQPQG